MWITKNHQEVSIMENPIVRQSNELIDASYKIATLGESRIIHLLISQIQPSDEDFKTYKISVSDFAQVFGLSERDGRLYEQIDEASKALTSRTITIRRGKSWLHMNWLSSAEYRSGSGFIELCFDKKLKPYLLQLKGYFTQYQLEKIAHFKSMYSIRIFELLKMEEFKADKEGKFRKSFEYEELRKKLGIEKELYKFIAAFKKFVIQVSEREINENSDINIYQIDYPKTGRKITHIVFHCEKKPREDNHNEEGNRKPETLPDDIRELIAMGIDEHVALQWRKKYGVKRLIRNITYTKAMHKAGKIRDSLTGFLATAITKNMGGAEEFKQEELEKKRKALKDAEAEKQQAELEKVTASKAHIKELAQQFERLSESEKNTLRIAFEKQLKPILKSFWNKAKECTPQQPETDRTVKVSFLLYFESVQESGKV